MTYGGFFYGLTGYGDSQLVVQYGPDFAARKQIFIQARSLSLIEADSLGNVVLLGASGSQVQLAKLDSHLNIIFSNEYFGGLSHFLINKTFNSGDTTTSHLYSLEKDWDTVHHMERLSRGLNFWGREIKPSRDGSLYILGDASFTYDLSTRTISTSKILAYRVQVR